MICTFICNLYRDEYFTADVFFLIKWKRSDKLPMLLLDYDLVCLCYVSCVRQCGIRYESDDVIWLRNQASMWILVPNIGCKQTMASNTGGPLTFSFGVHTFFFLITPRQYEEEKFRSNQTTLLKEILRLPIAE